MHALACLVLIALAYATQGAPSPRIIGGKDALPGKYPHQVSLRLYGQHFCGGSIINEYNVLTAAHCVIGLSRNLEYVTVNVGTNRLNETGDSYKASNITAHKNYDSYKIVNDIAIIHLASAIQFKKTVKPIKLASGNTNFEGKSCVLSGWGSTKLGGDSPNNLQEITLEIFSQEKCANRHWRVQDSHICTFTKTGEGACHGDSGGPLLVDNVQVGIVSFGQPCAVGYPDVFTRVTSFLDWINQNMKN